MPGTRKLGRATASRTAMLRAMAVSYTHLDVYKRQEQKAHSECYSILRFCQRKD